MEIFTENIGKIGEKALRKSIGEYIQHIKSGGFEIRLENDFIQSSTISINLDCEKYLTISNDWADTPIEYTNYYFLKVRIEKKPVNIRTEYDEEWGWDVITSPHSSISFGASSLVSEILVFEKNFIGESETVNFDSAILFKREDGIKFLIKTVDDISGELKIVLEEKHIEKELEGLTERLKFN